MPCNNHLTKWCRSRGITVHDLESHPQMDDLILLLRWRDFAGNNVSHDEEGFYAGLWGMVYKLHYPLKKLHLQRLEQITNNIQARQKTIRHLRHLGSKTASSSCGVNPR